MIRVKRVYAPAAKEDGWRVLVDRLWPRGMKKEAAKLDWWMKDVAPSDELRKSFHHESMKWATLRKNIKQSYKTKKSFLRN
jgi:uncharacterized protein YeaO (DUF488 family)